LPYHPIPRTLRKNTRTVSKPKTDNKKHPKSAKSANIGLDGNNVEIHQQFIRRMAVLRALSSFGIGLSSTTSSSPSLMNNNNNPNSNNSNNKHNSNDINNDDTDDKSDGRTTKKFKSNTSTKNTTTDRAVSPSSSSSSSSPGSIKSRPAYVGLVFRMYFQVDVLPLLGSSSFGLDQKARTKFGPAKESKSSGDSTRDDDAHDGDDRKGVGGGGTSYSITTLMNINNVGELRHNIAETIDAPPQSFDIIYTCSNGHTVNKEGTCSDGYQMKLSDENMLLQQLYQEGSGSSKQSVLQLHVISNDPQYTSIVTTNGDGITSNNLTNTKSSKMKASNNGKKKDNGKKITTMVKSGPNDDDMMLLSMKKGMCNNLSDEQLRALPISLIRSALNLMTQTATMSSSSNDNATNQLEALVHALSSGSSSSSSNNNSSNNSSSSTTMTTNATTTTTTTTREGIASTILSTKEMKDKNSNHHHHHHSVQRLLLRQV
jgi:hypothetical protein